MTNHSGEIQPSLVTCLRLNPAHDGEHERRPSCKSPSIVAAHPGDYALPGKGGGEARLAAALAPFGWQCGPEFWQRYYSDAWVFNLANAVQALSEHLELVLAEAAHPGSYEPPKDIE